MQVTANQVQRRSTAKYELWDGEMVVRVFQNTGGHGFHSAAILVERCDDPLEVRSAEWYDGMYSGRLAKPKAPMYQWIAEQLTALSTGTGLNLGGVGNVEGLRVTAEV